ncbi:MAG: hypothetical protein JO236_11340 [Mycobacterium sp.]|nr:hypothetical protein [Mycobacterium sp.]
MSKVSSGFDVRGRTLQAGELAAWLAEHSLGNRFGLDVVGTGKVQALAIVAADGDGRYIDVDDLIPDDEAPLASWLADPGPPKAVHEAKRAMHALAGRGWTLRGVTSDTALAAYLLRPQRPGADLNDLLVRHMRCALPTKAVEQQHHSAILRACAVLDLADVLDEELARIDCSSLLGRVELPLQRALANMETVGIAADRGSLARVREQLDNEIPDILGSRDELLNSIANDGRIHTTFHQTVSGRLSSAAPSLHNIAVGRIREALIAGKGYAELMTASYDQLARRIMAHLSVDARLLPEVFDDARKVGYAATVLGRRYYVPAVESGEDQVAMAIQGSAADIIKVAMIKVDQTITGAGLASRMVLQVDDELVFEVADGERDTLASLVRECMRDAYELEPPLEVSVGYGANWATAGHS